MTNRTHRSARWLLAVLVLMLGCFAPSASALAAGIIVSDDTRATSLRISVKVDFGNDLGQNFGSLFEACDKHGHAVAGAGFMEAYNTQSRGDRRMLQMFVRPQGRPSFQTERLPRANDGSNLYLFTFDGKLFGQGRAGNADKNLRVWTPKSRSWQVDNSTLPFSTHVAGDILSVLPQKAVWQGRMILKVPRTVGRIGAYYYAQGFLIFRLHAQEASPPRNDLIACPWVPGSDLRVEPSEGIVIPLGSPQEFVYAYGQLGGKIFAATNTGGVYMFDQQNWRVLVKPVIGVSFQIYSMINYYDRLFMGHYPTGHLYEFDGKELRLLKNWPPAMKKVLDRQREVQTMAIYGGDLYVGVWPWAELCRYGPAGGHWDYVGRLFDHPKPSSVLNPYRDEMKLMSRPYDRWGQRVASLIPYGPSLYVGTSAKGGTPWQPTYEFLSSGKWKDYGVVHRYTLPGNLSVATSWQAVTSFEFIIDEEHISVWQNGRELGSSNTPRGAVNRLRRATFVWGDGAYGKLRGKLLDAQIRDSDGRITP